MLNKFITLLFSVFLLSCNRLEITVPNGYIGRVSLIKANVATNELIVDTNGIGYINEKTFENLRLQPIVKDVSGKILTDNCVGYSPSAFWALGKAVSHKPKRKIESISFEIVPDSLKGQKQYYDSNLFKFVDTLKLK